MSDDPDKNEQVTAQQPALDAAAAAEADAQAARIEAEARAAEIREEVAITDQRRAEEEEGKAEEAIAAAQKAEAKKEQKRHEAEERRKAAAAEAQRAREQAANAAAAARGGTADTPLTVSGASIGSPGFGSDPKAAAAASHTSRVRTSAGSVKDPAAGPDKPEIEVAAVFAGAFLLARILKKVAG